MKLALAVAVSLFALARGAEAAEPEKGEKGEKGAEGARPARPAPAKGPDRVRVYYFGNSLTENTMPPFHAALGQSAGKTWETASLIAAGAPLFHLADQLDRDEWAYGGRSRTRLVSRPWDAITLQPATWLGLVRKGAETSGWVKEPDKEVGDLASASRIIDTFLGANGEGTVYVYSTWPSMTPGKGANGQPDPKAPERAAFDYQASWLAKYDAAAKWQGNTFYTRDYHHTLMEALKTKYPKLASAGRLRMIPVGDVFFELDRRLKKAKLPGLPGIDVFYTDIIHMRSGLPRYAVAATFFAVLFREDPAKLDWKVYADAARYKTTNDDADPARRFFVNVRDLGEHLDLTPERVKLVNETIWDVVRGHPDTGL